MVQSAQDLFSAILGRSFPAHPFFPQLQTVSDPKLMLELFRAHLTPMPGRELAIEDCAPSRFHWRRNGSRCLLQYALSVRENGNGRLSNLWVTSFIYAQPGQAEETWAELKQTQRAATLPDSLMKFEPLSLIPELQMLAQVFPYDALIPNLPLVLNGPWPELQEAMLAAFGSGCWQIEPTTIEPLRYRTEDSAVIRYTVRARDSVTSRTESKRFYVKVYRTRDGQQTFELLNQVRGRIEPNKNHFQVVEPLWYCGARRCLVLAEASGQSLQNILISSDRQNSERGLRRVARALAGFHQADIQAIIRHSADEQIKFLKRAAELLRWGCPALTPVIDEMSNVINSGLRDVTPVPIHWDLKADHVFLEGDRVTFLDLDTVSLGDPARDPAHLAAHIACRIDVPDMPAEFARAAAKAFIAEYFAHVPASWGEQFELQYLIAIIEGACGLFKRQERGWPDRAQFAIEEGRRALSNGLRRNRPHS